MAKAKPTLSNVRELRHSLGLNQSAFWSRFGVTQSGGSRYESGRNMPLPLQILVQSWLDKAIDDSTLEKLKGKIRKGA